jgi:hypothetical protein
MKMFDFFLMGVCAHTSIIFSINATPVVWGFDAVDGKNEGTCVHTPPSEKNETFSCDFCNIAIHYVPAVIMHGIMNNKMHHTQHHSPQLICRPFRFFSFPLSSRKRHQINKLSCLN